MPDAHQIEVAAGSDTALCAAAERGDARSQFLWGLRLATGGAGVDPDPAAAAAWCRRAAEQGLGEAQFNLGLLLLAGTGVPADRTLAAHWLELAALNGIAEAEACLDLLYDGGDPQARPQTWESASTRISVALKPSEAGAAKPLRFSEYYIDPCVDLLVRVHRFAQDEAEDITQQFFLELEEPLQRGADRGRPWKAALRERYRAERGPFRGYLHRILLNFAREYRRRLHRKGRTTAAEDEKPDLAAVADHHAETWDGVLRSFAQDVSRLRPDAARATTVILGVLREGLDQGALAAQLGVTDRTVRSDLRLGASLLTAWLSDRTAAIAATDAAVRQGLALLPGWLHRPIHDKRWRILLLLALIGRRLA
jgi:DNA-directed RNA polymerase specialized sigma24 family protein